MIQEPTQPLLSILGRQFHGQARDRSWANETRLSQDRRALPPQGKEFLRSVRIPRPAKGHTDRQTAFRRGSRKLRRLPLLGGRVAAVSRYEGRTPCPCHRNAGPPQVCRLPARSHPCQGGVQRGGGAGVPDRIFRHVEDSAAAKPLSGRVALVGHMRSVRLRYDHPDQKVWDYRNPDDLRMLSVLRVEGYAQARVPRPPTRSLRKSSTRPESETKKSD